METTIKILVVDDESRMRKLVRDFLVKKGYEVLEAADGEEALDLFYADKDISLIILDVMMPKMNGFEVCREIREHSKVPIIMLTAKSAESDELNGFELGVDEYISKPFSPKILVARVEAILRRTNQLEENQILTAGAIQVDRAAHIVTIEHYACSQTFREFMYRNGYHKQQNPVDAFIINRMMLFFAKVAVEARQMMQMRRDSVEQCDKQYTQCHTDQRLPPPSCSGHIHSRHNQTHQRRCKHHSRTEPEKYIIPLVRNLPDNQPGRRAQQRRKPEPTGAY